MTNFHRKVYVSHRPDWPTCNPAFYVSPSCITELAFPGNWLSHKEIFATKNDVHLIHERRQFLKTVSKGHTSSYPGKVDKWSRPHSLDDLVSCKYKNGCDDHCKQIKTTLPGAGSFSLWLKVYKQIISKTSNMNCGHHPGYIAKEAEPQ